MRVGEGGVCFSENTKLWCTRGVRFHVYWLGVTIARRQKIRQKVLLPRPMISVPDRRGQGALNPFCLTRAAILPNLTGMLSG